MNNWRLLLALVAVFQPISSSTEHKLVDGRQQCCDRQSPTPLGETRLSLHETYQLRKVTPALRRLSDWDETREDRRYELRQRNTVTQHRLTERSLVDAQARDTRFIRVEGNLGRIVNEQHLHDLRVREKATAKNRAFKDALGRQNDKTIISRRSSSNDNRFNRFSNVRLFKNVFDSQRDMQRMLFRFEESRFAQNRVRAARDVRNDAARSNLNNRDLVKQESLSAERRESFDTSTNHVDTNNERKDMKRHNEQRRSLSGITRLSERVSSLRVRLNSRLADWENYRYVSAALRLTERINERRHRSEQRESNSPDRIQTTRRESRGHTEERSEIRIKSGNNLSHEKTITEQRNICKSRNLHNIHNERDMDNRREIRYEKRSTEIRMNREKPDERVSRERSQIDRRNVRALRTMNNMVTENERDLARERETRFDVRSKENRENIDHSLSRERVHKDRRNIYGFRIMNNMVTQNEIRVAQSRRGIIPVERQTNNIEISDRGLTRERIRMERTNINKLVTRNDKDIESRREIRFNERLSISNRENLDRRLTRERVEMDRKNILGFRTIDKFNERDALNRREIRYNERLSRDIREEIKENSERNLVRENRQVNRRDIRETRAIRSMPSRIERDIENQREIRLLTQIHYGYPTSERRIESRSLGRISVEKNALVSRRVRSEDRRNFRDMKAETTQRRLTRSERATRAERRNKAENRNRELLESSSRYVQETSNRDRIRSVTVTKMDTENDTTVATWQYVLYTLQGAYLCALFMQMLTPCQPGKRHTIMSLRWLPQSYSYNPIKVD